MSMIAGAADDNMMISPGPESASAWTRYENALLGSGAVLIFLAFWEAAVTLGWVNPLFTSSPSRIARTAFQLFADGSIFHDLQIRGLEFITGFGLAVIVGVPLGILMGWRTRIGYALDPLMTVFYASPLAALAPLLVIFFGVGISGKTIIVFSLAVFPFIFNVASGVRAVDRLLINVVRSLGGRERDIYVKILLPSVLPYMVAGARIAVGRALIGVLVGEFFAASEGIGYAISRFGDIFAIDRMFACILTVMVIAVVLTEGIRFAERAAFPWRASQ